jgi:hypothetical protein
MLGIAVTGLAALAAAGHLRAVAAFALGATLGILGYFWLHETVEALLAAHRARVPREAVVKLALRHVLMAVLIYFGYRTRWLPVVAILGGLLVPGAGVMAECLLLLRNGFRDTRGEA